MDITSEISPNIKLSVEDKAKLESSTTQENSSISVIAMKNDNRQPKLKLACLALVFGGLVYSLLFVNSWGVGFLIFTVAIIVAFEAVKFFIITGYKFNWCVLLIIPIIFAANTFVFRSDGFVQFLNLVMMILLVPIYAVGSVNCRFFKHFNLMEFLGMSTLINYSENLFLPVKGLMGKMVGRAAGKSTARYIQKTIIAIAITTPILITVLALLTSGDQIFSKSIDNLFSNISFTDIDFETITKLTIAMILSFTAWSIIAGLLFHKSDLDVMSEKYAGKKSKEVFIPFFVLGALNFVYYFFIIIQFGYLFGGQDFVRNNGVIYSKYAINGFWEMLTVIVINYVVLSTTLSKISISARKAKYFLRPVFSFTVFASLVMAISSMSRILLYIDTYSFSRDRIIPLAFLFLVFAILVMLAIAVFLNDRIREKFLNISVSILAIVFVLVFNLFSMDRFIVQKNIERKDREVDYQYMINNLGVEGLDELLNHIKANPEDFQYGENANYKYGLLTRLNNFFYSSSGQYSWPTFNWVEYKLNTNFEEYVDSNMVNLNDSFKYYY